MPIFTSHELEFFASLRTDWGRLYRSELARLEHNRMTYDNSHHKSLENFPCFVSRYSLLR